MDKLLEFKAMRIRKGLTQIELSRRMNMSQQAVSQWESGRSKPPVNILRRLANTLEVDVEELIQCFE
ncbi:MAG: helix-turn-helix transcriptional regulator [Clostridiales bacterium]|nr:helix-turn-helix transcriptional regulator [Clostridiales bacterium]